MKTDRSGFQRVRMWITKVWVESHQRFPTRIFLCLDW